MGLRFLDTSQIVITFNPLNAELKHICQLLALFGAQHILHISRIRVNLLWSSVYFLFTILSTLYKVISVISASYYITFRKLLFNISLSLLSQANLKNKIEHN